MISRLRGVAFDHNFQMANAKMCHQQYGTGQVLPPCLQVRVFLHRWLFSGAF